MTPERIKALRAAMGITLWKFALKLGVEYSTLCHWQKGRFKPNEANIKKLEELCKEYGI